MFSRKDCIPYLGHIMNENGREKQIYWCYSKHILTIKMSNEFFILRSLFKTSATNLIHLNKTT